MDATTAAGPKNARQRQSFFGENRSAKNASGSGKGNVLFASSRSFATVSTSLPGYQLQTPCLETIEKGYANKRGRGEGG
jgi:hypothetical protein